METSISSVKLDSNLCVPFVCMYSREAQASLIRVPGSAKGDTVCDTAALGAYKIRETLPYALTRRQL
jgi:hypothetical protein